MGEKGSVPVSVVCLIITNSKRLSSLETVRWEFCSKVVLGVQYGRILEVNWHGIALQDFCCLFSSSRTFFLNNHLIDTRGKKSIISDILR